jgi:hypothetical protein
MHPILPISIKYTRFLNILEKILEEIPNVEEKE